MGIGKDLCDLGLHVSHCFNKVSTISARAYPLACLYFQIVQDLNLLENIPDHLTLGVSLTVVVQYNERFKESNGNILEGVYVLTSVVYMLNGSGCPFHTLVVFPNSFVLGFKAFHIQAPILLPVKSLDTSPYLAIKATSL